MSGFAMRACALRVGFRPIRFSEAHSRVGLQSCAGVLCAEKKPGRACEEPAALELRHAVVVVRVVVCALWTDAA